MTDRDNTVVTLRVTHIEPIVLKYEDCDVLRFTVNDDMTGLLHLRVSAGCRIETRS